MIEYNYVYIHYSLYAIYYTPYNTIHCIHTYYNTGETVTPAMMSGDDTGE